ncbi:MAG: radical SAM protein [Ignavibacteriae bacterium]|nr:radical SAM protein [Ignavibacteriota bacterium]NOG99665.1 radical SAM protein [Ignavibacteriota bacterium]
MISNRELYRLPWTLPDNAISWLEPTAMCNLACDGCYRENEAGSHKPFDEVKHELDIFQKYRNTDCISIAGGDPLLYPDIVKLVAEIKSRGLKPIVNTNGKALTKELLMDLKKAGVFGFTFHVDSKQGRGKEWKDKNEVELNELRYHYAKMLADAGDIACSFNSTVYEDTLQYVPELVEWAHKNIDIVHTMVFIAFRHVVPTMPFDWYAGGQKVDWDKIMYHSDTKRNVDILSTDVLAKVKEKFPEFEPCAYLNGTKKADSYKWLLSERVGTKKKIYGYVGPKFLELIMAGHHFIKGTYISYSSPKLNRMAKSAMLLLFPFDKGLRQATKQLLKNPIRLFKKTHMQSVLFIQPVDFMENGDQSMCDGCPDITVHKDELVWSCRLEELKNYGVFLRTVPKNNEKLEVE